MNKIALVLEGGAFRGIFTAGVIDSFIDHNVNFDYVLGVSAGAINTFAYVGKHRGLMRKCIMESDKRDFVGLKQIKDSHVYINLQNIFYDYFDECGFDFNSFVNSDIYWEMVTTNVETGQAEYMHTVNIDEVRLIATASCSMPILTKPVKFNNKIYLDGGVADSIPIKHALDKGYEKVVVVCTRRKGSYSKLKDAEKPIYKHLYSKYPNFIDTAFSRTESYKEEVELCERLDAEGKIILIRPTLPEVGRLETNLDELSLAYYHGYTKADEYINKIKNWLV